MTAITREQALAIVDELSLDHGDIGPECKALRSFIEQQAVAPVVAEFLSDDQIYDAVKEAGLDWHAGFALGDEENRYVKFARALLAAPLRAEEPAHSQPQGDRL